MKPLTKFVSDDSYCWRSTWFSCSALDWQALHIEVGYPLANTICCTWAPQDSHLLTSNGVANWAIVCAKPSMAAPKSSFWKRIGLPKVQSTVCGLVTSPFHSVYIFFIAGFCLSALS